MSPTQRSEDRAAELAVAAPYARENLLLGGSQQGGAAVVEDHAVEFARPVGFAGSARSVEQCLVRRCELLVRRVAQQRHEGADVRQTGYHLLNRHHGHEQIWPVSYTHLRAHETVLDLVCRLLLEKKKT